MTCVAKNNYAFVKRKDDIVFMLMKCVRNIPNFCVCPQLPESLNVFFSPYFSGTSKRIFATIKSPINGENSSNTILLILL